MRNNIFKQIHIGSLLEQYVSENEIEMNRICNFFNCSENIINEMYTKESLESEIILKWSKLLEYNFFRIYSQHLMLYSPQSRNYFKKESKIPIFRKNLYTPEIINYILEQHEKGEMSKTQIITEYRIPKTTLYRWMIKYQSNK